MICHHTDRIKFEWDQYRDRTFLFFASHVKIKSTGHAYPLGLLDKDRSSDLLQLKW